MEIDTFEQLYLAVRFNNKYYSTRGAFRYKSYHPKEENDITAIYKKIEFDCEKELINIYDVMEVAKNLNVESSISCSYSPKATNTLINTYTFDELVQSEFWGAINEHYSLTESQYQTYKDNTVYETKTAINVGLCHDGHYIDLSFDKITGYLEIYNKKFEFTDNIWKLHCMSYEEYDELKKYEKIVKLMKKGNNITFLDNGIVINNKYYEDIYDVDFERENCDNE